MASLLMEIQNVYSILSDKEKNIADFILANPEDASRRNIQELADQTGVSISTITRFAKRVSCRNFVEMKIRLASRADDAAGAGGISEGLLASYHEMLADVQSLNSPDTVDPVLRMMELASRIFIYGLGSSGLAAQELNYRLSRMGFTCEAITDPHLMTIRSTLLQEGDLVIAISRSGQTSDLIQSLRRGKDKGADLVAITAYANTPLTDLAKSILWTIHPGRSEFHQTGLDISTLYLIDRITLHFLADNQREQLYLQTIKAITHRTLP